MIKVFGAMQQLSNNICLILTSTAENFCVINFFLFALQKK